MRSGQKYASRLKATQVIIPMIAERVGTAELMGDEPASGRAYEAAGPATSKAHSYRLLTI